MFAAEIGSINRFVAQQTNQPTRTRILGCFITGKIIQIIGILQHRSWIIMFPSSRNISVKTKIFSKIFKGVNLGSRYYGFMKNPDFENLMLLSL